MNRNNFLLHTQDGIVEFIVNDNKLDLIVNGLKESFDYKNVILNIMTLRVSDGTKGGIFDLKNMANCSNFCELIKSKVNGNNKR